MNHLYLKKYLLKLLYTLFLFFLLYPHTLFAEEITKEIRFNKSSLSGKEINGYQLLSLKPDKLTPGAILHTTEAGSPMLPFYEIHILIPQDATVNSLEVTSTNNEKLPDKYLLFPSQRPQPLIYNIPAPKFISPNPAIYKSSIHYPGNLAKLVGTGNKGGYKIASILIYPIQYIPLEKQVIFYSSIKIKLTYNHNSQTNLLTPFQKNIIKQEIKNTVLNPENIELYAPYTASKQNEIPYCIITNNALSVEFQRLADWKTRKGVNSKVMIVDSIYSTFSGTDRQAKIREFIKYAYTNWGTQYFLLGGQCDFENNEEIVPRRDAFCINTGISPYVDGDTLPSDLYYSDLDGTWDKNGNGTYGEMDDSIDLYSDVYVGRAPAKDINQAKIFVDKVLAYEKNPLKGYAKKILLVGAELWPSNNYNGDIVSDSIIFITPSDWSKGKLYYKDGNLSRDAIVDSVNAGFGLIHYAAHGGPPVMRVAGESFSIPYVDILNNINKFGIHNAISCFTGALDEVNSTEYNYDCLAEHIVNNPNGGGVASIMNTRYGWGTPPTMGMAELLDVEFYNQLFNSETYHLGIAHALSKNPYCGIAQTDTFWRYSIYELTLFGDPELPIWTKDPENLAVSYLSTIGTGSQNFNVHCSHNSSPKESIFVCLMKGTEIYKTGYTNSAGNVIFNISPTIPGNMYVTATAHNFYPYEGTSTVVGQGPYVSYKNHNIIDNIGNRDSTANPGETIDLYLTLWNPGSTTASSVNGIITINDTLVSSISDTIQNYGNILSKDSSISSGTYKISISPNTPDMHTIKIGIKITDNSSNTWYDSLNIQVATPKPVYQSYLLNDSDGSTPNGYLDPDEEAKITPRVKNTGTGNLDSVKAVLRTISPYATIMDSVSTFGKMPNTETKNGTPFKVKTTSSINVGDSIVFAIQTIGWNGIMQYLNSDTIILKIGIPGVMYADHNVGNIQYTVTCNGICGFTKQNGEGNGLKYPPNGHNLLWIGSLWVGNSPNYVVNRDFNAEGTGDWKETSTPDGKLRIGGNKFSNQDGIAIYNDANHPTPKNITVTQLSSAWSTSPYNDFVVIKYKITNNGTATVNNLYAGQYMDFDVDTLNSLKDKVGIDNSRHLIYQYTKANSKCTGIKLISPITPTNLSGVNSVTYMYPEWFIQDSTKIKFLNGSLTSTILDTADDWGILASAGPFNLDAGKDTTISFAIIGGDSIADLKYNSDMAGVIIGIEDKEKNTPLIYKLYPCMPNPTKNKAFIIYSVPKISEVKIIIYDITGRITKNFLFKGVLPGLHSTLWDGTNLHGNKVSTGVYFIHFISKAEDSQHQDENEVKYRNKLIIIR
ncbi:MAG: C25 family cysteine peptidase [bacterium]|nr:C25 family cysteine peptidase [bacterium]